MINWHLTPHQRRQSSLMIITLMTDDDNDDGIILMETDDDYDSASFVAGVGAGEAKRKRPCSGSGVVMKGLWGCYARERGL